MLRSFVGIVLAVAAVARAEGPVANVPASPKAAAIVFVRAMEADDLAAFRAATVGTEEDYHLFEPLLHMVGSARDLEKAAREKFGKDGSGIVRQSPALGMEIHVQESDVKVTGDRATLHHKADAEADALTLRKISGQWKVDLTAIKNRQSMTAAAGTMRRMQQALSQSAADIRAGKFTSAQDAERAVATRIQRASAG